MFAFNFFLNNPVVLLIYRSCLIVNFANGLDLLDSRVCHWHMQISSRLGRTRVLEEALTLVLSCDRPRRMLLLLEVANSEARVVPN